MTKTMLVVLTLALVPATASAYTENILTHNRTNYWAWATALGWKRQALGYSSLENIAAWCINPWSDDKHGGFPVRAASVRYEFTAKNCSHPVTHDAYINTLPASNTAEVRVTQQTCTDMRTLKPYDCFRFSVPSSMDNRAKPTMCPFTCQEVLPINNRCIGPATNQCGAPPNSFLRTGQTLQTNQYLRSPNRLYYLLMQPDGNLCVYKNSWGDAPEGVLWCHNRGGTGGQFVLAMQHDGNLCTYPGTVGHGQKNANWCSGALAPGGEFFVTVQDDGNLCVYKGTGPTNNRGGVWCTNAVTMRKSAPAEPQPSLWGQKAQ